MKIIRHYKNTRSFDLIKYILNSNCFITHGSNLIKLKLYYQFKMFSNKIE